MKKRSFSLVLILILAFQCFAVVQGAVDNVEKNSEIPVGIKHMEFLKALGIITNETDGTMVVTRAAAALYITRMLNEEQNLYAYKGIFADVPISHENALAIERLADLGIVKGGSDYSFRPDDFLTYIEAYYIFANVLGYGGVEGINADAFKYVKQHGITNGVVAEFKYVNLSDLLIMVYNALHSTTLDQYV